MGWLTAPAVKPNYALFVHFPPGLRLHMNNFSYIIII